MAEAPRLPAAFRARRGPDPSCRTCDGTGEQPVGEECPRCRAPFGGSDVWLVVPWPRWSRERTAQFLKLAAAVQADPARDLWAELASWADVPRAQVDAVRLLHGERPAGELLNAIGFAQREVHDLGRTDGRLAALDVASERWRAVKGQWAALFDSALRQSPGTPRRCPLPERFCVFCGEKPGAVLDENGRCGHCGEVFSPCPPPHRYFTRQTPALANPSLGRLAPGAGAPVPGSSGDRSSQVPSAGPGSVEANAARDAAPASEGSGAGGGEVCQAPREAPAVRGALDRALERASSSDGPEAARPARTGTELPGAEGGGPPPAPAPGGRVHSIASAAPEEMVAVYGGQPPRFTAAADSAPPPAAEPPRARGGIGSACVALAQELSDHLHEEIVRRTNLGAIAERLAQIPPGDKRRPDAEQLVGQVLAIYLATEWNFQAASKVALAYFTPAELAAVLQRIRSSQEDAARA